ncbi:MAG: peptide chain release factor 1 [Omnitrophica bacterium RIFCSPHIGHO2_02_FULL_51_18]|nr:MAG: peptide chain release factor 1 [Omnitrophica bacterium RIFCSPHIGHO2_02_FULL_51_18]
MRFLKKVEEKVKRFKEVERELQDPVISQDTPRVKELGREYKNLERTVRLYREYLKIQGEAAEARHILGDKAQTEEFQSMAKRELESLEEKRKKIVHEIEGLLIQEDPKLLKNAILEIRAGTGGLEAGLFAGDLLRMYSRYSALLGFQFEILSSSPNEAGGFKEVIVSVNGGGAYGKFKFESGTHRVQRVPATEASGRIHTSAVTVAVLPEAEEVDVEIKPEELKIDVFRSGGPGGQSVNTTDSAVRITHVLSGLVVSCQDEKSQLKNKQKAMKVLRARLYEKITHERDSEIAKARKEQVGSGDRSEKIRTYNFQDRRVTDHRVGLTIYNLEAVLEGGIAPFVDALYEEELGKA